MIDIDKAQNLILEDVKATVLDKDITNQGVYLLFEDVKIVNHLNIDYNFSIFVAVGSYNKNKILMYEVLNDTLNAVNSSFNIDLKSCKFLSMKGNLLIYQLSITTKIIGDGGIYEE